MIRSNRYVRKIRFPLVKKGVEMDIRLTVLYFFIGGIFVTLTTMLAKSGQSTLAAMATIFPAITAISILSTSQGGDTKSAAHLALKILLMLPVWGVFAFTVWRLMAKGLGPVPSLIFGLILYLGLGYLEYAVFNHFKLFQ